jgi:hypothetical protein
MASRLVRSHWFSILWLGVILGATLVPLEPSEEVSPILCLLMRVVALGALLSFGVETAQFWLPGRDSSLSDFLFNTLGTAVGVALAHSVSTWWRPEPSVANVLSVGGALSAGSVLALTGVLLGPALPDDTYYGGWTPRLGHLEWYGGRVLQASLGGLAIPPGALAISSQVRQQLLADATIHVRARAGPRPSGFAPLFTIADGHQREILLLGVDGDDLVYRYRTRAIASGLHGPEIRAHGALRGIAWRDPLSVIVRPADSGYCFHVNATEHCGLGFTMGDGWAFLFGGQPGFSLASTHPQSWLACRPLLPLVGALAGFLAGWLSNRVSPSKRLPPEGRARPLGRRQHRCDGSSPPAHRSAR